MQDDGDERTDSRIPAEEEKQRDLAPATDGSAARKFRHIIPATLDRTEKREDEQEGDVR